MTDADHERLSHSLGAYLLGALDEGERQRVAAHLTTCQRCRDELAGLSELPTRLALVGASDLDAVEGDPTVQADAFVARALSARARQQGRQKAWKVVAAVAVVLAAIAVVRPAARHIAPEGVAMTVLDASGAAGSTAAVAKPWGTEIHLVARQLPLGAGYRLWAVGQDGHREIAASWAPTAANRYAVIGATGMAPGRLSRIEVTTSDDAPILATTL